MWLFYPLPLLYLFWFPPSLHPSRPQEDPLGCCLNAKTGRVQLTPQLSLDVLPNNPEDIDTILASPRLYGLVQSAELREIVSQKVLSEISPVFAKHRGAFRLGSDNRINAAFASLFPMPIRVFQCSILLSTSTRGYHYDERMDHAVTIWLPLDDVVTCCPLALDGKMFRHVQRGQAVVFNSARVLHGGMCAGLDCNRRVLVCRIDLESCDARIRPEFCKE